jgi:hypothetical protein
LFGVQDMLNRINTLKQQNAEHERTIAQLRRQNQ